MTLDALGTLVELEDPYRRLADELAARGAPVEVEAARTALRAEMAHYREHHDIASDLDGLARLRADCTEVLRAALPRAGSGLGHDTLLDALLPRCASARSDEVGRTSCATFAPRAPFSSS